MDDKKKILILGALFVVIIGIGAFQFVKGGEPAPAATASKNEAAKSDTSSTKVADSKPEGGQPATSSTGEATASKEGDATVDPALVVAAKLDPRDPFDGRRWDKSDTKPQPTAAPPQPTQKPVRVPRPPSGISGAGFRPAGVPIDGVLPEAGSAGGAIPNGQMPSVEDFPYVVSGTVTGDKPVVILTDAAGKQKIVPVGSQVDGDSQIVSVSNGKVTVRHRGKTKTVPVGGINPSNNKQEGN